MITKERIIELLNEVIEITKEDTEYEILLSEKGFDSLSFIRFVVLLEESYNIEVLDSDLLYENFSTINKIFETVSKYAEQSN